MPEPPPAFRVQRCSVVFWVEAPCFLRLAQLTSVWKLRQPSAFSHRLGRKLTGWAVRPHTQCTANEYPVFEIKWKKLCLHFFLRILFPSLYLITLQQRPGDAKWNQAEKSMMCFLERLKDRVEWLGFPSNFPDCEHSLCSFPCPNPGKCRMEHLKVNFACLWLFYKSCHSIEIASVAHYLLLSVVLVSFVS